ncbi:hypothetical protein [Caballeronia grimmiae]|uniref:Uncharacterized protein n=1 Tax=Caballeronia grimmiae TaxID=1071679 RepID=A0A069N9G7_9BURK|nr:hypothetical protein [Caballeronia grimmiae]KDR24667.1 hypothetical protein BG57_04480 [Caballeronia grimmiae]GGD93711.1 hypothetical protein GCM10010985_55540 [Caballeronia grimmiae]
MTTVVIWQTRQSFSSVPDNAIWLIADSRASSTAGGGGILTDRCAKVFEVPVRVRSRDFDSTATLAVAVAGHTLVAHNAVFCLQQALAALIGSRLPTVNEVVEFAAKILGDLTMDVGFLQRDKAFSELIIAGATEPDTSPEAWSLRPKIIKGVTTIEMTLLDLSEGPYCTGVAPDVEAFRVAYQAKLADDRKKGREQYLLDQLPITCFDKIFLVEKSAEKTGGEMQIVATNGIDTLRFMPFRYEPSQAELSGDPAKQIGDWMGMYRFLFFGSDVFGAKIGECQIGLEPWQLADVPAVPNQ